MAGVRWLTDQEQEAWRAYLQATLLLVDALGRELQSDSGLSHADYEVLVRLSEAPDRRIRMSELSEATTFSRSRLSHAVGRLERAGWVRRSACPTDKRGVEAELTGAGFAKLAAAAPSHVAAVRKFMFDHLSRDQLAQLYEIFAAVREPLAAVAERCREEE
jgi:DNA-binding MarR family transcriptional regulator